MSANFRTKESPGLRLILRLPGNAPCALHLAEAGGWELGAIETGRFPDFETHVRVLLDVADRPGYLACTLSRPDDGFQRLVLAAAFPRANPTLGMPGFRLVRSRGDGDSASCLCSVDDLGTRAAPRLRPGRRSDGADHRLPACAGAGDADFHYGGVGRGAQASVLVKNAGALERIERIDTLVVDKTGTRALGIGAVADPVKPTIPL